MLNWQKTEQRYSESLDFFLAIGIPIFGTVIHWQQGNIQIAILFLLFTIVFSPVTYHVFVKSFDT
jgi:hypothetical protein